MVTTSAPLTKVQIAAKNLRMLEIYGPYMRDHYDQDEVKEPGTWGFREFVFLAKAMTLEMQISFLHVQPTA